VEEDAVGRHPWPGSATWRWSRTRGCRTMATSGRHNQRAHPGWSRCSHDHPCGDDDPRQWWEPDEEPSSGGSGRACRGPVDEGQGAWPPEGT
jgi:hypothetical protein